MRETNPSQAYAFTTLVENLRELEKIMPYARASAIREEENYRDGVACLSLSSPYHITSELALQLAEDGKLADAFLRATHTAMVSTEGEIKIFFIVEGVWKIGDLLPNYLTHDYNRALEEAVIAHKIAHEGPKLHIVK